MIDIYQMKMDYKDRSIETLQMVLKNRQSYVEHLFNLRHSNDLTLIEPLERLAELYKSVEKCDEALVNYQKALEISEQQTLPDWNGIHRQAIEVVNIYTKHKNNPQPALKCQAIVHETESKEEVEFGQFMTALELHKLRLNN